MFLSNGGYVRSQKGCSSEVVASSDGENAEEEANGEDATFANTEHVANLRSELIVHKVN